MAWEAIVDSIVEWFFSAALTSASCSPASLVGRAEGNTNHEFLRVPGAGVFRLEIMYISRGLLIQRGLAFDQRGVG